MLAVNVNLSYHRAVLMCEVCVDMRAFMCVFVCVKQFLNQAKQVRQSSYITLSYQIIHKGRQKVSDKTEN